VNVFHNFIQAGVDRASFVGSPVKISGAPRWVYASAYLKYKSVKFVKILKFWISDGLKLV